MKREELTGLLCDAAAAQGFAFYTCPENELHETVRAYPAACLVPIGLHSKTGRNEGEVVYEVTMHLMALQNSIDAEPVWQPLVEKTLAIVGTVCESIDVLGCGNVSIKPSKQALSDHGELAATLKCDITMWYQI